MPRASSEASYNTFVKGLITEASPLSYPPNASLDEDNFVLERNGKRSRRLGIDYESGYALINSGLLAEVIEGTRVSFHRWDSPGEDTTTAIGIVRIYNKLWFLNLLEQNPSANLLNSGSAITIADLQNADIETQVINNALVIVSSELPLPILLEYDPITDTVTQSTITIKIRDFLGVDDTLSITDRPTTLTAEHRYNLRNQGWNSRIQTTCGTDALDCTFSTLGYYPSNSDVWTVAKVGDSSSANYEKYDPNLLIRNSLDIAQSPKGSYIIDAFPRGASRISVSGISGLPLDKENGSPSTIATYQSRLFYSGINSMVDDSDDRTPVYTNYIFFTQTITSNDKLGYCYQEADPTSPDISDIIDTDGGTIQIPEATKIIKLYGARSSLIVFAENGVWEIYGDTGGFKATDYQLNKISDIGITNSKAVVEANGALFYFANSGIFTLVQDNASGRYLAQSISLTTIHTFYNDLPDLTKLNTRGFYEERENRIRWLYNDSDTYTSGSYINKYNKELILDLTLQAFYTHSISDLEMGSPYVTDYVEFPTYVTSEVSEDIYVGSDRVLSDADVVFINTLGYEQRTTQFGFLTMMDTYFTISKYSNTGFLDWETADSVGVDYSSYLVTGYELFGDIMRKKQVTYLFAFFERTEDNIISLGGDNLDLDNQSSCLIQAQWQWTNSATSGKWGTEFQGYRFKRPVLLSGVGTFDYSETVIVSKNKLRGSGNSLSLKFSSETGKDMRLLGWAVAFSGPGSV